MRSVLFFLIIQCLVGFSGLALAQTSENKIVRGQVTFQDVPVPNVNIAVEGTSRGTRSDIEGRFEIRVDAGNVIAFSHVGFRSIEIVIEDTTEVLNIALDDFVNELDEVIITSRKEVNQLESFEEAMSIEIKTPSGTFKPKAFSSVVHYVSNSELKRVASPTLGDFLYNRYAGVDAGSLRYFVDGIPYFQEPAIPYGQIVHMYVTKGSVFILTENAPELIRLRRERTAEKFRNQNFYANDASSVTPEVLYSSAYSVVIRNFNSKEEAFAIYTNHLSDQIEDYPDHIAVAKEFAFYYEDVTMATEILTALSQQHANRPDILKAIAYQLQALGSRRQAVLLYEKIARLRPDYAQSYRDLANAYHENEQFRHAWRYYMAYLRKGGEMNDEGISDMVYTEMEYLYFNRKNQTEIKETFVPKSENIYDSRKDIRVVFEWNTSEAEFELEFVNPGQRSYQFDHSLAGNPDLISDEKTKGYSSKEFIIDDLGTGVWLANLSYKGNKTSQPTFLKAAVYYDWGSPNQRQEIRIYQLHERRDKLQLFRFTNETRETAGR